MGGGAGGSDGVVRAPMTGTVMKVQCKVGDVVEADQTLAVLTAMKMEHKLSAGIAGVVRKVLAQEGGTVEQGSVLVEVEARLLLAIAGPDGDVHQLSYYSLPLQMDRVSFLPLSWTIVHPINGESPLAGLTQDELIRRRAELLLIVKGLDEGYMQPVITRHSYRYDEIAWGGRFVRVYGVEGGEARLYLSKLSSYTPEAAPERLPDGTAVQDRLPEFGYTILRLGKTRIDAEPLERAIAAYGAPVKTLDIDEQSWDRILDINTKGVLFLSQAFLPSMRARKKGSIACMSSVSAQRFLRVCRSR